MRADDLCRDSKQEGVDRAGDLGVSNILRAYPDLFGDRWFQVIDGIDLAGLFEVASANRRIAQPRSAIATLVFERMRQHFPDRARRGSKPA